jgi:hypothetical protein
MKRVRFAAWYPIAVAASLVPATVSAQALAISFDELQGVLKGGQSVVITDNGGATTNGEFTSLSAAGLEFASVPRFGFGVPERRMLAEGAVSQIGVADSLQNGFSIGVAVGVGAGLALVAASYSGGGGDVTTGQYAGLFGLLGGAGGGLVGAAVDASLKAVVYRTSPPQGSLTLSPLVGKPNKACSPHSGSDESCGTVVR